MTATPKPVDLVDSINERLTMNAELADMCAAIFDVLDDEGRIRGVIAAEVLRLLTTEKDAAGWAIAADVMQAPVTARADDDLRSAAKKMIDHHLRELLVADADGRVAGFLDEAAIAKAYLAGTGRAAAREVQ